MSPIDKVRRKIFKNKEAKVLPYFVIVLMIGAVLTSMFLIPNAPLTQKASAADAEDYSYVKKITIESDFISADLVNYPFLIHDNTGDLADILTDGSDIAFFNATNATQYNHEIESYDDTTGELYAWVNVTDVTAATDIILWMYYDDSDGSYSADGYNAESVWDSSFVSVYHFADLTDSTSNGYDLSGGATSTTGEIDGAYDFEQDSNQFLYDTTYFDLSTVGTWTLEIYMQSESTDGDMGGMYLGDQDSYSSDVIFCEHRIRDDKFHCGIMNDDSNRRLVRSAANFPISEYFYAASTHTTAESHMYVRGESDDVSVYSDGSIDMAQFTTNEIWFDGANSGDEIDGIVDEARVSKEVRSTTWINLTNYVLTNESGLITLGAEAAAGGTSSYTINGLPDNRLTWAGTAGTDVWCNATGTDSETLEINISVIDTDNVTEVRVYVGDLNDTDAFVNASNITLYVSSDNSSFASMGAFTDGGSNISLNDSQWPVGAGNDPFEGAGITDKDSSIYCRFKLAIPADSPTDEFTASASDAWHVYIGHYV